MTTVREHTPASVVKRNGKIEPFSQDKIEHAVFRCLNEGCGLPSSTSGEIATTISRCVLNILSQKSGTPTVEEIQDVVIQQLYAQEYFDAATRYVLYREARKKEREKETEQSIPLEDYQAVEASIGYLPTPIQQFQHYTKYARFNYEKQRRETYTELTDRVMGFFQDEFGEKLLPEEWQMLKTSILEQKAMPSMRLMQMAGPAAKRCNVCAYNCAYVPLDSITSFCELLYILMQGTGCSFSVEAEYIDKLPRIKRRRTNYKTTVHIVGDSTEGWCDCFRLCLEAWFNGDDVIPDCSNVRQQGEILLTKGGRASGPEPFIGLINFTRNIFAKYWETGGRITTLDALDIADYEGFIVEMGGVRRAAELCLFDLEDREVRTAKHGPIWDTNPQRQLSNNSAVYETKPDSEEFLRAMLDLIAGKSGEPGIFFRGGKIPRRRRRARFGTNPCGEIILRPRQFCNLSICVARKGDTIADLEHKIICATIFGTLQSALTNFNYIGEEWRKNCEEERLLGVDITGQLDCELLRPGAPGREELFTHLKELVIKTNEEIAPRIGVNPSVATTCTKPGGNSAQYLMCNSSLTPWWANNFIRRCEAATYDPVTKLMMDAGVPWIPKPGQTREGCTTVLFEFPIEIPEGSITRYDMTAIEQLDNWLVVKVNYTEHNPSYTCYVAENEWPEVIAWIYRNWEYIGGLSFLPKDGGVYPGAPYQDVAKEEYKKRVVEFPRIPWEKLRLYETTDNTTSAFEFSCVGDKCLI